MIAGRGADDAAPLVFVGEQGEFVQRPANFVRPYPLKHLRFEPNVVACELAQLTRRQQRSVFDMRRDATPHLNEVVKCQGHRYQARRTTRCAPQAPQTRQRQSRYRHAPLFQRRIDTRTAYREWDAPRSSSRSSLGWRSPAARARARLARDAGRTPEWLSSPTGSSAHGRAPSEA